MHVDDKYDRYGAVDRNDLSNRQGRGDGISGKYKRPFVMDFFAMVDGVMDWWARSIP